jgi:hypothetical protein
MSIYTWTSEIKNIYVWTTPAKAVYVWTTKVRPSWWTPWSNTVLYYPFKDDILDKAWWTSISVSWTKKNIWYQFSTTGIVNLNNSDVWCKFISVWAELNWKASWNYHVQSPCTNYWIILYNYYSYWSPQYQKKYQAYTNSSTIVSSNEYSLTDNQWYHLAYWWDGSKVYWYINWSKIWEYTTSSIYYYNKVQLLREMTITYSELIWETEMWSWDKILSYYNSTKSNYWL